MASEGREGGECVTNGAATQDCFYYKGNTKLGIVAGALYGFEVLLTAYDQIDAVAVIVKLYATALGNAAAPPTIYSSVVHLVSGSAALAGVTAALAADGNNLKVTVTGVTGADLTWLGVGRVLNNE